VVFIALVTIHRWDVLLGGVVSVAVAVVAGWYAISRRGTTRLLAVVLVGVALVAFVTLMVASHSVRVLAVALALSATSVAAAGYALAPGVRHDDAPAPAPLHPVLILNPRSGGGKVERFSLVDLCRQRGVEPRVLESGDDLRTVAEDAVAGGADVIGMAGGDGSLAIVASVASRHGIPFVVVPAGTRNHFALDLGVDRGDVPGALDAYAHGVDVRVDLAEVNGRVFVNNASMGVYAKLVQSAGYRDAKLRTAADLLPDLLGPGYVPLDLHYDLPTGEPGPSAQLLLVSNNRYDMDRLGGKGTRERLNAGVLGVVSLRIASAADAETVAALDVAGQLRRFAGFHEWATTEFVVRSSEPVEIGVDGEALVLQPPLRFVIRPGDVTVRLPVMALARLRAVHTPRLNTTGTVAALWRVASGRSEAAG
jgi:diacylglycerol kinase family enzyme